MRHVQNHGTQKPSGVDLGTMSANQREAEYARIVQIHQEKEDRRARHNLRRRAIKKRDLLHKFQRRRLQNFLREDEVVGCARAPPLVPSPPPPTKTVPSKRETQHTKCPQAPKDWMFYKRNGFIWCDLGRTPKARLALVVPPIAVKREREFIEQLLRKVEAEDALNRQRAKEQHERVAAQRERLRNKIALNKAHHAQSMAALSEMPGMAKSKKSTEKTSEGREAVDFPGPEAGDRGLVPERKDRRRVVLSERHEQLACPRKPPDGVRSFVVSGSTDLVGLLHANPVLKGYLDWHLEDLRDDILTSQPALFQRTGQAENTLSSRLPPGLPQTAPQLRAACSSAEAVGGHRSGGGKKRHLSQSYL